MRAWSVLLNGKPLDTVFFDADLDAEYVKNSLVNHDGMPPDIEVSPETSIFNKSQIDK